MAIELITAGIASFAAASADVVAVTIKPFATSIGSLAAASVEGAIAGSALDLTAGDGVPGSWSPGDAGSDVFAEGIR